MPQDCIDRKDVKRGFFWSAIESYIGQIVQFIIGIILARLLTPNDYGAIALTTIFICISNALLSSGLPTALLRKKECTDADFSTIFSFNILIALVMFGLLWIYSPFVAGFYKMPVLNSVLRGMGVTFLIGSLSTVSTVILKRKLQFKGIAIINLISQVTTGIAAIVLAFYGFGVWTLVIQAISSSFLTSLLIIWHAKWWPHFGFSKTTFKELFGFGSKILGGNIFTQIYQNMYGILIGKFFSAADVAFFTRADGYSKLVPLNISGVIQRSLLPLLTKAQDNQEELVRFNMKMNHLVSFLVFPLSMILCGLAYPIISLTITDKWITTAPLLQILCISVLPDHLYCINNDFILVRGRSDLVMKEQFYTKTISIVLFLATIPLGLKWIAVSKGISSLITWIFSAAYIKRVLGIGIVASSKGLILPLLTSILIGGADAIVFKYLQFNYTNLILALIISVIIYIAAAKLFFSQYLVSIVNLRK